MAIKPSTCSQRRRHISNSNNALPSALISAHTPPSNTITTMALFQSAPLTSPPERHHGASSSLLLREPTAPLPRVPILPNHYNDNKSITKGHHQALQLNRSSVHYNHQQLAPDILSTLVKQALLQAQQLAPDILSTLVQSSLVQR